MAKKKDGKPGPGKKACPECGTVVGVRTMVCPNEDCGYKWPKKEKSGGTNGGSLKSHLNARLKELDKLLASKDQWEKEKEQIEGLLETMEG